jgi:hypothetical protein
MQTLERLTDAAAPEQATRMYRRVLANWAGDLLRQRPGIAWPADDPEADYRDRDWRKMYAGDVLDD